MFCQIKSSKAAPPFRQIYRKMKISTGGFEVRHRNIRQNAVDGLNGFFKGNNNNARINSLLQTNSLTDVGLDIAQCIDVDSWNIKVQQKLQPKEWDVFKFAPIRIKCNTRQGKIRSRTKCIFFFLVKILLDFKSQHSIALLGRSP